MKIIQSLKSRKGASDTNGWLSPEFNWMSWALSCLQLTKLHGKIELYTNSIGKEILIDKLQLPYTKVHLVLNEIELPDPQLWAYSKLVVYGMQKQPFLHIDGDVFLWEKFNNSFLQAPIAVQNLEFDADNYYSSISEQVNYENFWLPKCIQQQQKTEEGLFAYNAGCIGGNDINFFKEFTNLAFEFLDRNRIKISKLKTPELLNVYFEQYLFYCLAKERKIKPKSYYKQAVGPMNYKNHFFVNFLSVPYKTKYIHTIGTYKRDFDTCLMLAKRLKKDYPDYYNRILEECDKSGIQTIVKLKNSNKTIPTSLSFYRTKINLVGLNEAAIKAIKDNDLRAMINTVSSKKNKDKIA